MPAISTTPAAPVMVQPALTVTVNSALTPTPQLSYTQYLTVSDPMNPGSGAYVSDPSASSVVTVP